MTRQLFFVTAQVNSKKTLDPKKIMPLPYDDDGQKGLTKAQANDLKDFMKYINSKNKG